MTVTPAIIRAHFETDLDEAALQRIIDALQDEVTQWAGPVGVYTERVRPMGRGPNVYLRYPAATVETVTETHYSADTELSANDYRIEYGGRTLVRLDTGDNPRSYWGAESVVSYTIAADANRRDMAIIDLAKIELQFNGVLAENAGGYNKSIGDSWRAKRAGILRSVRRGRMVS